MSIEMTGKGHAVWRAGYEQGWRDRALAQPLADKVRLYLDFDGVINAPEAHRVWPGTLMGYGFEFADSLLTGAKNVKLEHTWAHDLVAQLAALDVEVVWLTTWTSRASSSLGQKLGLGAGARYLVPLNGAPVTHPSVDWKMEALFADQEASPSFFIWAEDDITESHMRRTKAQFGDRSFLVSPNPSTGLEPHMVAAIRGFITTVQEN